MLNIDKANDNKEEGNAMTELEKVKKKLEEFYFNGGAASELAGDDIAEIINDIEEIIKDADKR